MRRLPSRWALGLLLFLAARAGALQGPAVEASREGLALTFWEYVEESDVPLDPVEAGRGLRLCHEALSDFSGGLPRMAVLDEAGRIVERLAEAGSVSDDDSAALRRLAAWCARAWSASRSPSSQCTVTRTWAT